MKIELEDHDIEEIRIAIQNWIGLDLTDEEIKIYVRKNRYLLDDFYLSVRNQIVCDMGMKLIGKAIPA